MTHAATVRLPPPPQLTPAVNLLLRLPRRGDAGDIVAHARDADTVRWTTIPSPYRLSDAHTYIESVADGWTTDVAALAIEHRGRFAGSVDLRLQALGRASVGYALAPWARGKGLMTRSLRALLAWGFTLPGLEIVNWQAYEGNWASRRVAQRCGFRMDGTVRRGGEQRGHRRDTWTGSLRRGEPLHGTPEQP